jgi:hypothetical protein
MFAVNKINIAVQLHVSLTTSCIHFDLLQRGPMSLIIEGTCMMWLACRDYYSARKTLLVDAFALVHGLLAVEKDPTLYKRRRDVRGTGRALLLTTMSKQAPCMIWRGPAGALPLRPTTWLGFFNYIAPAQPLLSSNRSMETSQPMKKTK